MTFDPAIAMAHRSLEFISLHHPIVRALANSDELSSELSCCAGLVVALDLDLAGPHAFFVFELHATGLKDELELAAVVVSPDGEVIDAGSNLLASLESARDLIRVEPPATATIDRMHGAALDWITGEVAAREQDLQMRSDETITAQVESLRLSTDRRRLWLREQIEEGRSTPILRMRQAQLSRLETDFETKLARLERKRGVSVGYRLVAAGLVASSA